MALLRFDKRFDAADTLRRLAQDADLRATYMEIRRLLFELREEPPDDPVAGTPLRTIGDGLAYYRLVGTHPNVYAVIWRRLEDGSVGIIYIGTELL